MYVPLAKLRSGPKHFYLHIFSYLNSISWSKLRMYQRIHKGPVIVYGPLKDKL